MVKGVTAPDAQHGVYSHSAIAKFGDVAHIPGTGPSGTACDECIFMVHSKGAKQYGRCEKAAIVRGLTLVDLGYIDRWNSSCHHFQPRPEGVTPWARRKAILKALQDHEDAETAKHAAFLARYVKPTFTVG